MDQSIFTVWNTMEPLKGVNQASIHEHGELKK